MNCPLCNRTLLKDKSNSIICSKSVKFGDNIVVPHYRLDNNDVIDVYFSNYIYRHIMYVLPYRIITFDSYSIVQKINKNYSFSNLFQSPPIKPNNTKSLINKINTLLVFS